MVQWCSGAGREGVKSLLVERASERNCTTLLLVGVRGMWCSAVRPRERHCESTHSHGRVVDTAGGEKSRLALAVQAIGETRTSCARVSSIQVDAAAEVSTGCGLSYGEGLRAYRRGRALQTSPALRSGCTQVGAQAR